MRTTLTERLRVECPYVRARQYMHDMLDAACNGDLPHEIRLTANLPRTGVELAKYVFVHYGRASDPMHFDEPWQVHWLPEPGGIYPSFEGQLTVRADEGYRTALLELRGHYTPPLGAAGRAFDAVLGRRIAASTAQNLLAYIASQMRERYAVEEAAKRDALIPAGARK